MKSRNCYARRVTELKADLKDQMIVHKELEKEAVFRKGTRNVSIYGGYNMALRRTAGHASSEATFVMVAGPEAAGGLKDKHSDTI